MKHLSKIALSVILTLFITACSTENEDNISEINANNLFSKINLDKLESVSEFSETITDLSFLQSIKIIDANNEKVNFTLETSNIFLNGVETSLSKRIFEIENNGFNYVLSDNSQKFSIEVNIKSNEYILIENNTYTNLADLKNKKINSETERNIPLFLYIIDELTRTDIKQTFSSNNILAKRRYMGTGLGFHTNLSDAEAFCQQDHDQILADNPGWWSNGVSYSCAWGEHICVCSSNFYS